MLRYIPACLECGGSSVHGDKSRAADLKYSVIRHKIDESVQLTAVARDLYGKSVLIVVDDAVSEDVDRVDDLAARLSCGLDLDYYKLAVDRGFRQHLLDLLYAVYLGELTYDLVSGAVVAVHYYCHTGDTGVLRNSNGKRLDIKASSCEHSRNSGERARFIRNENAYNKSFHIYVSLRL